MPNKSRARLAGAAPRSVALAIVLAVVLFAGGYAAGRDTAPPVGYVGPLQKAAQPLPGGIGLVTAEQVIAADPDTYVLIDVRGRDAYDFAHAVGAISLPESEMVEMAPTLPTDKTLVLYCTCPDDKTSLRAGRTLTGVFHVPNVVVLTGGLIDLRAAGAAMSADVTDSAIEHQGCGCSSNAEAFKLWAINKAATPTVEATAETSE
jgi:rhodanese-related sulfurtransferase